jgi:hypothetical protein
MYRIRNLVGEGYFSGFSSASSGIPLYASAEYLSFGDLISAGEIAATLRNSHEQCVKVEMIAGDAEAARPLTQVLERTSF